MAFFDWRQFWFVQTGFAMVIGIVCALVIGRLSLPRPDAVSAKSGAAATGAPGWTVKEVLRTPQFYILLAAYFSHLLSGVAVASVSVAHLTERGITWCRRCRRDAEPGIGGRGRLRLSAWGLGFLGNQINPKHLLLFALTVNAARRCFALADAGS